MRPYLEQRRQSSSRDRGTVLVLSLVMTLVIVALCGSVALVDTAGSREIADATESRQAFYLADAGIESAKWELATDSDPDQNGIGNRDVDVGYGAYNATVTALTPDAYEILSTGSAGGSSVSLRVVVETIYSTTFPHGGLSIVGDIQDLDVEIEEDADLVIDGGDSPALSISDTGLYTRLGNEFVQAVSSGQLPATNITGAPLNTFPGSVDPTLALPINNDPSYSSVLSDLSSLYSELTAKADTLRTSAQVIGPSLSSTYGSPGSPVTVYAPALTTVTNQTITGYGTLVVGDLLTIGSGATLNWAGDIIVVGDAAKDAELKIESGALNLDGNLVVLGQGVVDTEFEVKSGGQAVVNGSVLLASDWSSESAPEAELEINGSASLTVNGLLTLIGSDVGVEFETVPNPNNQITVNGMMQVAVPGGGETSLNIELEGAAEIVKNAAAIEAGAAELQRLADTQNILEMYRLVKKDAVVTTAWQRVTN